MDDEDDGDISVQRALKVIRNGTNLSRKICKSAKISTAKVVVEAAQNLENVLSQNEDRIRNSYTQSRNEFGQPFVKALKADATSKIQGLTLDLSTQLIDLRECFDESVTLELGQIQSFEKEAEKCCNAIFEVLAKTRQQFLPIEPEVPRAAIRRGNVQSISISTTRVAPQLTAQAPAVSIPYRATFPVTMTERRGIGSMSPREQSHFLRTPVQSEPRMRVDSGYGTYQSSHSNSPEKIVLTSSPQSDKHRISANSTTLGLEGRQISQFPSLISREEVQRRLSANEEFFSRRQRNKADFQRQILEERTAVVQMFGIQDSPLWESDLSRTLRLPGFGDNITQGIEVVKDESSSSDGPIPVAEGSPPTSAPSVLSVDCPIRHDRSFYRYGGFCEGARMMLRGEKDYFKIWQRPVVKKAKARFIWLANDSQGGGPSFVCETAPEDIPLVNTMGIYFAAITIRCVKCAYEVNWAAFKKDNSLDSTSIHTSVEHGIRYRTSFLSKCHVKTKNANDPVYACVFCVDEHRTIEDHDATVFFSVAQLMRHLSRHPRQVRHVDGIKVCYGNPTTSDFDLNFIRMDVAPNPLGSIVTRTTHLPTARAIVTDRPKSTKHIPKDPDGNPILQFATGAFIVGVTFPERFHGQWCHGYHDGDSGLFPSYTIQLNVPVGNVVMETKSPPVAVAKWDHKPKSSASSDWLTFSKKEKITHIGYPFEDHWCWSGQNSKGKFGLFPRVFVADLVAEKNVRSGTGGSRLLFLKPGRKNT